MTSWVDMAALLVFLVTAAAMADRLRQDKTGILRIRRVSKGATSIHRIIGEQAGSE